MLDSVFYRRRQHVVLGVYTGCTVMPGFLVGLDGICKLPGSSIPSSLVDNPVYSPNNSIRPLPTPTERHGRRRRLTSSTPHRHKVASTSPTELPITSAVVALRHVITLLFTVDA